MVHKQGTPYGYDQIPKDRKEAEEYKMPYRLGDIPRPRCVTDWVEFNFPLAC